MKWPNTRFECSKSGVTVDPEQIEQALAVVRGRAPGQTAPPTDLLVLAHGWNNGRDAAGSARLSPNPEQSPDTTLSCSSTGAGLTTQGHS